MSKLFDDNTSRISFRNLAPVAELSRRIWFHWVRPPVIRSFVARAIALQYSRLLLLDAAAPDNPGWIVDAR